VDRLDEDAPVFGRDVQDALEAALLHKSAEGRPSPFPGRIYSTASVTGMPSAE
jgi:hypothetical protein